VNPMPKRTRATKLTDTQRRWRYIFRRGLLGVAIGVVVAALIAADRAGVFGVAPPPDQTKYNDKTFRVIHVVDGDTIDLDVPDLRAGKPFTRVRLWGVDTPEIHLDDSPPRHFGPQAAAFTRRAVLGRNVRIMLEPGRRPRGKYGRLLAFVHLGDGKILNAELIEQGFGYADPRFDHHLKKRFGKLQRSARRGGRGLWKNLADSDLPHYYRNKLKPIKQADRTAATMPGNK